jgi:predicted dehydrogenase
MIATTAHIPVLRAMPDVEIVWITDAKESRARAVATHNAVRFASLRRGLNGLPSCDVMLLAIPLPPRAPFFDHCARSGTAVMAEKPLAADAIQHAGVASRFPSWQLAVGYQRRHYASSLLLKSLIERGVFGNLLAIRMNEGGRVLRTGGSGEYQDAATADGGGIVKNLGCHSLDLALWLTKAGGYVIKDRAIEWDGPTDRRARAEFELTELLGIPGYSCKLHWTVSWLDIQPNCYEFEFTEMLLRCPVAPDDYLELLGRDRAVITRLRTPAGTGAITSAQAFYLEWRDFLDSLQSRRAPVLSALSCHKVAQAIDQLCLQ